VPKHKAAEVSRGHSTSRFFFLREGLNIMVRSFTTRLGRWCKDSHTVFFFSGTGLLPEVRTESGDKAGELIQGLHPGRTANDKN